MHIVVPASTLVEVLIVVVLLGILLHFFRRARRPTRRASGRRLFGKRRARQGRRDHGLEVARRYGHNRSPEWPRVAQEHLLHEPACVACGYKGRGLQVHHIKPFHLYPDLELDPRNLITLCEVKGRDHHLLIGHLDDWESYNPNVREDTHRFHRESARQIRANPAWQEEEMHRPRPQAYAV